MQASAGSGRSGAAARAAGPVSLLLRERPVNACIECRLRIFDGNGFSESDLVGRPSDPKPEIILRNLENICRERGVLNIRVSFDCCSYDCMPCVCFWPAAMADVFDLPPSAAGQLASIRKGAQFTMLNVEDFAKDSDQHQEWTKAVNDEQLQQGLMARITDAFKLPAGALKLDAMGIQHFQEGEEDRTKIHIRVYGALSDLQPIPTYYSAQDQPVAVVYGQSLPLRLGRRNITPVAADRGRMGRLSAVLGRRRRRWVVDDSDSGGEDGGERGGRTEAGGAGRPVRLGGGAGKRGWVT